jgi:hypothetical protein
VAGGYPWITKPERHAELHKLLAHLPEPTPLTRATLETAIAIRCNNPSAAEIQAVCGIRTMTPSGIVIAPPAPLADDGAVF